MKAKWLWLVTAANGISIVFLILILCSITIALSVLAPAISIVPLYVALSGSGVLSVIALVIAMRVASSAWRWVAFALNGSALVLDVAIVLVMASLACRATKQQFIIPVDYKGDVYVLYGIHDDALPLQHTGSTTIYRIPKDGILRTSDAAIPGLTQDEYFYESPDGILNRIPNFWPVTIQPTPENLANNRDLGVFFPRSGSLHNSTDCAVEFTQFYVGAKANLLTEYREKDMSRYLRDHPTGCANQKK